MASERFYYAERQCRELEANVLGQWQDCMSQYGLIYEVWEFTRIAGLIAFVIGMVAFVLYQCRAEIEEAFVNGIATVIKGKRRLNQNVSDTKTRIADKIDKAANE